MLAPAIGVLFALGRGPAHPRPVVGLARGPVGGLWSAAHGLAALGHACTFVLKLLRLTRASPGR
eukprot:8656453-Lingulodinium_polyedra.AAC.1